MSTSFRLTRKSSKSSGPRKVSRSTRYSMKHPCLSVVSSPWSVARNRLCNPTTQQNVTGNKFWLLTTDHGLLTKELFRHRLQPIHVVSAMGREMLAAQSLAIHLHDLRSQVLQLSKRQLGRFAVEDDVVRTGRRE